MNWPTNSAPYGYGGRTAATTVLPVRITMLPTSSSSALVGKKVRSATVRTTSVSRSSRRATAPPCAACCKRKGRSWKNTTLNLRVTPAQLEGGAHAPRPRPRMRGRPVAACGDRDNRRFLTHPVVCSRPPMRRGAGRSFATVAALSAVLAVTACGSGARQDATEPTGKYPVQITTASFPTSQHLSQHTRLTLAIRNTGNKTIPDVVVTICNATCTYPAPVGEGTSVAAFATYLNTPGVANHSRPVWVVEKPPGPCQGAAGYSCANGGAGGEVSADTNTWQGGRLKPGSTKSFTWSLTAVNPGRYTVAWEIDASLYGKAKAVGPNGSIPRGAFTVNIARRPAQ